ncbi:MAG: NAD(P)H-dependent oxidoreductase [Thermoflavifilum sp.]|nr:NAD(P)H-dependent oxidoreductase [Thermoflavifilum sp.]MCL6512983.1 NAD(P)H-dependent oxidoreductase [Alicyclobacillus sp.]
MRLATLVGSLRRDSLNMKLARWMQARYHDKLEMEILPIGDLPFYNTDQELDPPPVVREFKRKVKDADAVLIVTPEYNWSIPGVLKNAIDWLSRVEKVMNGKPALIAGVSNGMMGTIRAQLHLREVLASPGVGARLFPPGGNEILITFGDQKFDAAGQLNDEATVAFIDGVIDKFIDWCRA